MELLTRDTKKSIYIPDKFLHYEYNESLIHQVITSYASTSRKLISSQKNRSDVSGSGKKPWKQKGTGRARSGSLRSPLWRSGGVTFTSKNRNYFKKVNKKMYKSALRSIFSRLILENKLIILESLELETFKTKFLIKKLKDLSIENALIIFDKISKNIFLSSRNLKKIKICSVLKINVYQLINFDNIVFLENVLKIFMEMFI